MNATERGSNLGAKFRLDQPALFEQMTVKEYGEYGRVLSRQYYASREKRHQFMLGWYAVNKQFFCLMADGPRRKIVSLTIRCERCGAEETMKLDGISTTRARSYECRPCPVCQKGEKGG